jgi:hypothetical protein
MEQKIMDNDPNLDWRMQIRRDVNKALRVYQHILVYMKT